MILAYTNLGLLLSDQCEHTIKCARYKGKDKIFTSSELEGYLNKSKSSTRQIIQALLKAHDIKKVGKGPATKYIVN